MISFVCNISNETWEKYIACKMDCYSVKRTLLICKKNKQTNTITRVHNMHSAANHQPAFGEPAEAASPLGSVICVNYRLQLFYSRFCSQTRGTRSKREAWKTHGMKKGGGWTEAWRMLAFLDWISGFLVFLVVYSESPVQGGIFNSLLQKKAIKFGLCKFSYRKSIN